MTEAQVGFLYKVASSLQQLGRSQNLTMLRSYYLMRCNEITKGYGLPDKHFSSKVRCTRCCVEWRKGTETRINPIKLSKKQRRRIRTKEVTKENKDLVQKKELLLNNKLEQICTFCKSITTTVVTKPEKLKSRKKETIIGTTLIKPDENIMQLKKQMTTNKLEVQTHSKDVNKSNNKKTKEIDVYNQTKDVFSLKNSKNTIASAVKEPTKVIKNNKKRKDKYAGLCQKAVLASAKLTQESKKKSKLSLFLKPSV